MGVNRVCHAVSNMMNRYLFVTGCMPEHLEPNIESTSVRYEIEAD